MTSVQVVETSVTVTNSSFQNYTHLDNHTKQTIGEIVWQKREIMVFLNSFKLDFSFLRINRNFSYVENLQIKHLNWQSIREEF